MLCERCRTEIALANALDAEADVDRLRHELLVGGEHRVLSPTVWALFEALYAGRGHPVSRDLLIKAILSSSLREHVRQLRREMRGSRFRAETRRGVGYELRTDRDYPHAEATYRVIPLDDGAFAVEVTILKAFPAKVRQFATKAGADAWIAEHRCRVQSENEPGRRFRKSSTGGVPRRGS